MTITDPSPVPATGTIWLDVTRKCQLECSFCYNSSGPGGGHGSMTLEDWMRTVDQAAEAGVGLVQLIGGEPLLYPHAARIAEHALARGMAVEAYSNLVHVTSAWWTLLQQAGMSLATTYNSSDPAQHNAMTGRGSSHARTRANIVRALELGVPLRVAIITTDLSGVQETQAELAALGVERITVDRVRPYGRGAEEGGEPSCEGLCGACGDGRASIGPDGSVSPCGFSTWMSTGNVRDQGLADILNGPQMRGARARIRAEQGDPPPNRLPCSPDEDTCTPGGPPSWCGPRT